ncbi:MULTISPECIES: DUF4394 domain-containing protein [unclassified Aeromicrobium]|uniref:DUF4394 domain-containing protein n=1 Tax=unclassified Aeromicrobium TaxID=2633570 RepID=UPI0007008687|nr:MULTISPECIES: DUF4394 domain-containing protein [unclassified Aeromicrobium]KQO38975.1 hypothetical protein ASF05_03630 [Aeromicrobium sp. Leaf245]KQP24831.1 hypothetical protein ASF38_14935 [Aeromicrobium sp. Leaf272]KQP79671.1 hypothetical protein ASF37_01235 [Aeromicrobium sp. Leaf289]KQP82237.1 hypothetical protein ASF35_12440 [Aeromicrobium sp. Leaf291]
MRTSHVQPRSRRRAAAAAAAAVALVATAGLVVSADAAVVEPSGKALGLAGDGKVLHRLNLDQPSRLTTLGPVKGLTGEDERLVGIDFRVQNGRYYGVGNAGGIYTVNSGNGQAVKVSQLSVALEGRDFGVDFNPAADRLRIVSDTGQNLRHDVNQPTPTTAVDTPLSYGDGAAQGVTAVAYTNNDTSAKTGTFLYDIDTSLDQLAVQVPANAGTLALAGPLGTNAVGVAGFDIVTVLDDGVAVDNVGFAVLRPARSNTSSVLYEIELQSGAATRVGNFPRSVGDIAIQVP